MRAFIFAFIKWAESLLISQKYHISVDARNFNIRIPHLYTQHTSYSTLAGLRTRGHWRFSNENLFMQRKEEIQIRSNSIFSIRNITLKKRMPHGSEIPMKSNALSWFLFFAPVCSVFTFDSPNCVESWSQIGGELVGDDDDDDDYDSWTMFHKK